MDPAFQAPREGAAISSLQRHFLSLGALFLSAFLLFVAQGMMLAAVPLRLVATGASATTVSFIASIYFVGILCGSWLSGAIIEQVGHIRAFAGFVALIISSTLLLALNHQAGSVAVIRFMHGWAAAGTFLTMESWLHASTPNSWRGRVVSAYTFLTLAALGLGQVLISLLGFEGPTPIVIGGVVLAVSIVPIALGNTRSPRLVELDLLSWAQLFSIAPLGVLTGFAAGLNMGAFWALGPVFGRAFYPGHAGLITATIVFGGALLVWPFGLISDRVGRRKVIALSGVLGGIVALALGFNLISSPSVAFLLFALHGGVIFSQYPLGLSYAADRSTSADLTVQLTRGLLLCNGFGTAFGPVAAGFAMNWFGSSGLFVFAACVSIFVVVVAFWRIVRDTPIPPEQQSSFVPMTETTPAALAIDPRTELDGQLELKL